MLNADEKKVRQERLSQFKINYQYRDYHFQPGELKVAEPDKPTVALHRIHKDINILALILTLLCLLCHYSPQNSPHAQKHLGHRCFNIRLF